MNLLAFDVFDVKLIVFMLQQPKLDARLLKAEKHFRVDSIGKEIVELGGFHALVAWLVFHWYVNGLS